MFYLILLSLIYQNVHSAELISTTAGQVKDKIITSREVELNYMIEKVLSEDEREISAISRLDIESKSFAKEVNAVLSEWMVYLESETFTAVSVPMEHINKRTKAGVEKLEKIKAYKSLEPGEKEVLAMFERKLKARALTKFKSESAVVPVTDADAKLYFEQNRAKFGNLPFENFKENIKSSLVRQQVDSRLKDWYDVLRSKYRVRNFLAEI